MERFERRAGTYGLAGPSTALRFAQDDGVEVGLEKADLLGVGAMFQNEKSFGFW